MKFRGFLLTVLLILGAHAMIESLQTDKEIALSDLLYSMSDPYTSLILTKPNTAVAPANTWVVDDAQEIDELLSFLEHYNVRKLKPEEIDVDDDQDQFIIDLIDHAGNTVSIFVNEDLIVQNSMRYYEIVDGPLDVDWFIQFFIHNQI